MWITNDENDSKLINLDTVTNITCISHEYMRNHCIVFTFPNSTQEWSFQKATDRDKVYAKLSKLIEPEIIYLG